MTGRPMSLEQHGRPHGAEPTRRGAGLGLAAAFGLGRALLALCFSATGWRWEGLPSSWPGLGAGSLFEDRHLAPTLDLRSVAKGLLCQHLGLDGAALAQVFPASDAAQPLSGLLRS